MVSAGEGITDGMVLVGGGNNVVWECGDGNSEHLRVCSPSKVSIAERTSKGSSWSEDRLFVAALPARGNLALARRPRAYRRQLSRRGSVTYHSHQKYTTLRTQVIICPLATILHRRALDESQNMPRHRWMRWKTQCARKHLPSVIDKAICRKQLHQAHSRLPHRYPDASFDTS